MAPARSGGEASSRTPPIGTRGAGALAQPAFQFRARLSGVCVVPLVENGMRAWETPIAVGAGGAVAVATRGATWERPSGSEPRPQQPG